MNSNTMNNRVCKRAIQLAMLAALLLVGGARAAEPLRVLILSGKNVHDWKTTTPELQRIYEESGRFKVVEVLNDPATCTAANLARCDVVVCNWTAHPEMHGHPWGEVAERAISDFVRGGKGFVAFHAASTAYYDWPEFQQLVALTWKWQFTSHTAYATFKVAIDDRDHPITRGLSDFWITDELYQNMVTLTRTDYRLLCKAFARTDISGTGRFEPMLVTTQLGQGRGLNLLLGHDVPAMRNIGFRTLLLRGTEWAASGQVTVPIPANWPATAAMAAVTDPDPDAILKAAASYTFGQPRSALFNLEQLVIASHAATDEAGVARRKQLAAKTAALLQTSIASEAKSFLCKQLALMATEEHVPAVATLLIDESTSDAARNVLERVPGKAAGDALRHALQQTGSLIRVGMINSLGSRAEIDSVEPLGRLLRDGDELTVTAAAAALGKIGNDQATKALEAMWDQTTGRSHQALAEALLACAGNLGESALRRLQEYAPTRTAVMRRLLMAEPAKGNDLVVQALAGQDLAERTMALGLIREFPREVETRRLAEQLAKLPTESATLLLIALADRGDKTALPATIQAAGHAEAAVRVAALQAIGKLGDGANVQFLVDRALSGADAEKAAAMQALAALRGQDVNAVIVRLLEQASAEVKVVLMRSLAARGASEMIDAPLRAVQDANDQIRIEAWQALEELAREKDLPTLVQGLVKAGRAERAAAEQAVIAVVKQVAPDRPRATVVMDEWATAQESAAKCSLVRVLATIGDEAALTALRSALKEQDTAVCDLVVRVLGTWRTTAPLGDLLRLARGEPDEGRRLNALRSYVRLAKQAKGQSEEEMIAGIRDLLKLANLPEDQTALLGLLALQRTPAAMQLGLAYLKNPALADAAADAVVQIASSLANTHKDEVKAAMREVQAATKSPPILEKAAGVLSKAEKPRNLALGATATSPDGLDPDGASGGDTAAIDGDPNTYWDEVDGADLYRLKVTLKEPQDVSSVNILWHPYEQHQAKNLNVLCDGKVVAEVRNRKCVQNEMFIAFPSVRCTSVELVIPGKNGLVSPAIHEFQIFGPSTPQSAGSGGSRRTDESLEPPNYGWKQTDASLALLNHDRVVWQWNYAANQAKPYFHPIALTDGTILTAPSPSDHPWHRALWFSWKMLNGVNYWEEDAATGKAQGLTEVRSAKLTPNADGSARIEFELSYHPPEAAPVLTENRLIEVSVPDERGAYRINWRGTFTAGDKEVLLQGGTAGGGYAGLSVRVSQASGEWVLIDSEGRRDTDRESGNSGGLAVNTHGQRARWADFSLVDTATQQPCGIAILAHPSNPRHPSQWHNILAATGRFGYFSPAMLWSEPFTLPAGKQFTLRYRILVHPGRADKETIEKEWQALASGSLPAR